MVEAVVAQGQAPGDQVKWPWVSRSTAEAWQAHAERADARFDALWQKYLDATRPPEPKAVVAQTYRSDEQAVRVVEDGFVKKLAADLKAKGIPDAVAQMEATRIRRETTRVGA